MIDPHLAVVFEEIGQPHRFVAQGGKGQQSPRVQSDPSGQQHSSVRDVYGTHECATAYAEASVDMTAKRPINFALYLPHCTTHADLTGQP